VGLPDNLKAAIIRACWNEPEAQQAYRECAEHYDFLIAPCRPRMPQHKGKVEQGGVHYVKRNFLGGREETTISKANEPRRPSVLPPLPGPHRCRAAGHDLPGDHWIFVIL